MKKILIVDDEVEVCNLIRSALEGEGFEADIAYGGKEALNKIKDSNYSLILLDIMMPDLSGEDVLGIIRRTVGKLPVIYVTIKPKEEVDLKQVDGFVQKPFKNGDLIKVVKDIAE